MALDHIEAELYAILDGREFSALNTRHALSGWRLWSYYTALEF